MTAFGLCCDHPRIRLHWHTRPDGSKGPFWLTCACGAFTDYADTHDEAWRLESALCLPVRTPAAALPRQSGNHFNEVL